MTKKISWSIFLTSLLTFVVTAFLFMSFLYHHFTYKQISQLKEEIKFISYGINTSGIDYLKDIDDINTRITLIDRKGNVLYDSSNQDVSQNHLDRKEIIEALKDGEGSSIRYSKTLTKRLFYVADTLKNGDIIRLAVSEQTVFVSLFKILPLILLLFVFILIFSRILAKKIAKKIIKPLEKIDLEKPIILNTDIYQELSPFLNKIHQNQMIIKEKELNLNQKTEEFEMTISKIKEAMLILDRSSRILKYNPAAKNLFKLDQLCLGKEIVMIKRQSDFVSIVENTLKGNKTESILKFDHQQYKVIGRPIFFNQSVTGMVLLCFDESEKSQLENLRREFTANVTHELRTPLHIMSGYLEILKQRNVLKEDRDIFVDKAYQESQRMIKLVDDILQLSRLDTVKELKFEAIKIKPLIQTVLDNLKQKLDAKAIKTILEIEDVSIKANQALLYSIVYNLCENAIKYNKDNGELLVKVISEKQSVILTIKDSGIGIEAKEIDRIFERFYRVDKSRNKKIEGTGLGLSIVKHAVQLHQATIDVESEVNKGTMVTVKFNRDI